MAGGGVSVGWSVAAGFVGGSAGGGSSFGLRVIVGGMSVRVGVGVRDGVLVGVRVGEAVEVADAVTVNVAVGENVTVGVNVAVGLGSGLPVSTPASPPVFGIRYSGSESPGWLAFHIRLGTTKAPMAVARRIAQIKVALIFTANLPFHTNNRPLCQHPSCPNRRQRDIYMTGEQPKSFTVGAGDQWSVTLES